MKAWKITTATLFVVMLTVPTMLGAVPLHVHTPIGTVSTAVPEADARRRNTANNQLRNLRVLTAGTGFTQSFAPTRCGYIINVRENVGRVVIQPTRGNNQQTIRHRAENRQPNLSWTNGSWSGWRSGNAANNSITININHGQERRLRFQVRDRAGNIREYSVHLRRASTNTWASGLTTNAGSFNRGFNRSVTNYTLNLPAGTASARLRLTSEHNNAHVWARGGTSGAWATDAGRGGRNMTVSVAPGASRTVQFNVRGAFSGPAPSPARDRIYTVTINRAAGATNTVPATTPIFTLSGSGWGHGVGMSQNGAMQMAREGRTANQILQHYFTGVTIAQRTPANETRMRVNLDAGRANRTQWRIGPRDGTAGSSLTINNSNFTGANAPYTFTVNGNNIRMTNRNGAVTNFGSSIRITGTGGLTTVLDQSGPPLPSASHRFVRYRGTMELTVVSGRLRLVNELPMQQYLYGVVPREIPSGNNAIRTAIEAQAIAARSFAHSHTNNATGVSSTVSFQVYGGHSRFASEANWRSGTAVTNLEHANSNGAVDRTNRQVLLHGGNVVRAYYSACNGNHTANSEDVWSSRIGHLRAVPDPFCGRSGHAGHNWTLTMTGMELAERLRVRGASVPAGAGRTVYVTSFNSTRATGGWVRSVRVNWSNGTSTTISNADNVRIRMGLRSSNFTATRTVPTGRAAIAPLGADIDLGFEPLSLDLDDAIEELVEGDYSPLYITQEMRNYQDEDCGTYCESGDGEDSEE
ncbi:MAG: SpoIID/LytB domain-containing protein [Coriobacteriia bacterium]|nr:SpoIID/LytB domain-containing protein [Coriobacteriia bacterium]